MNPGDEAAFVQEAGRFIFKVAAGRDPLDSTSVAFDHPDYPSKYETNRKFTIGVPREYFGEGLDPEVRAVVDGI